MPSDSPFRKTAKEILTTDLPLDALERTRVLEVRNQAFRLELALAYTPIIKAEFGLHSSDTTYKGKQDIRDRFVQALATHDLAITHPDDPALGPCMLAVINDDYGGHYCLVSRIDNSRKGYYKSITELVGLPTFSLEPDLPRREHRRSTISVYTSPESKGRQL
jgi:hypothetical protein